MKSYLSEPYEGTLDSRACSDLFSENQAHTYARVKKAVEYYPFNLNNYLKFKILFPGGIYYMILKESYSPLFEPSRHCIVTIREKHRAKKENIFKEGEIDFFIYNEELSIY